MNKPIQVTFPEFTISGTDIDDIIDDAVDVILDFRKVARVEFQQLLSAQVEDVESTDVKNSHRSN
jgi:hypothetical protein